MNLKNRGRLALIGLFVFTVLAGLAAVQTTYAQNVDPNLPDLVPMGFGNAIVTSRLGGPTLEFDILTANIGGHDFKRPSRGGFLVMPQIYEYTLYNLQDGEYVEVDRRRKTTICTIDDGARGNVFPCIQEHGVRYTCSQLNQGISRGWADSYFRGLTGQWSFIGDNTGSFMLVAELDPDLHLTGDDIPKSGLDATHDDNYFEVYFDYTGGAFIQNVQEVLYFDRDAVCP